MTIDTLGNILNTIEVDAQTHETMKFAHFAWSHAPVGDYGVYAEDSQEFFSADNLSQERMIEGTIDYFTRNDSPLIEKLIRTALYDAKVFAYLDTVQYEEDTGFIHYSWVFRFPLTDS